MINYLKKDIILSKKWLLIAILYCITVGYVMVKEEGNSFYFVNFLVPFFLVQLPLGKILNMEDHRDTRDFLKRMPQKGWIRVAARNLFIAGLILFGFACINLYEYMMVDEYQLYDGIKLGVVLFLTFLAYFSIEMIMFYRFSYHLAQNCMTFLIVGVLILSVAEKHFEWKLDVGNISSIFVYVLLALVNVILFLFEIKSEVRS